MGAFTVPLGATSSATWCRWRGSSPGGQGAEIRFALAEGSLGALLVAASDKGFAPFPGERPPRLCCMREDRFSAASLVADAGADAFDEGLATVAGFVEAPEERSPCESAPDT
ncbi:hypothetical protein [Halomonas sp. E19]|uniref:hypothetical protein n=1 Tax=Halomonas sp. E19 TaxID=3397247 RepID=UPI0040334158